MSCRCRLSLRLPYMPDKDSLPCLRFPLGRQLIVPMIQTARVGSGLLTWDGPSIQTGPDGGSRIVWMKGADSSWEVRRILCCDLNTRRQQQVRESMAASPDRAHPSISNLRPTSANEVLYDGPAAELDSGRDCRLRVIARWLPNQEVRWKANFSEPGHWPWNDDTTCRFRLKTGGGYAGQEVVGHISRQDLASASGWMDGGAVVGNTEAVVPEVSSRWINLGDVGGDTWLEVVSFDGTQRRWAGRQSWRLGEWTMTVDARPDLRAVTRTLKDTGKYAVTHLAVLRRLDEKPFTAVECIPILTAYQLASSFVLGRFTSPALTEARDDDGRLMWREWSVRLADQLGGITAWWNRTAAPIADPIRLLGDWLLDPRRHRVAEYLAQASIASNRGGFVEQRITTAFAALELLSWQRTVLEGVADPDKHDNKRADQRLRTMLTNAKVPISLPEHLSALVAFAHDEGLGDGPRSVTEVRHRLTHPKAPDDLYARKRLLTDGWLLTVRYLELLILHWIGYTGQVVDRTKLGGFPQLDPVPWAP